MADTAHMKTDEKLKEMEKRLSVIYSRANKKIGKRWKEYLAESQAEIDELQKAYGMSKKTNAEILQGILQSESMDKIAGRLSKVTEMNETAEIRNARVIITGAESKRAARQLCAGSY